MCYNHEKYMKRCIELAQLALGNTYENPVVGAVIVHKGKIIGEGYHRKSGEAHAEVNAINSVKNQNLLKESTIYVSLEPCSHIGKTPACSTLIINKKIPRVVVGTIDPFNKVKGKGIKMLKQAGIDVTIGVLEKECRELNKRFFTYHEKKRPYVILKWAQTIDGFIDSDGKFSSESWITNNTSKALVHKWRTEEQAILIGRITAAKDNPQLNVRNWSGNNPVRLIIDLNDNLPKNLKIFDNSQKTIIYSYSKTEKSGENTEFIKLDKNKNIINQILSHLYKIGIQSLIVEGGEKVLSQFINSGNWDEARVFIGNKMFVSGVKAPVLMQLPEKELDLFESKLFFYRNKQSVL